MPAARENVAITAPSAKRLAPESRTSVEFEEIVVRIG
jgi:hypothetical protein